jgi:hypothetical protein
MEFVLIPPLCEVATCQNLMILAGLGDLRTRLDFGCPSSAGPPLLQRSLSGLGLDLTLGGWQVNGITTLSTGTPLGISASNNAGIFNQAIRANNNGRSGALSGPVQDRLDRFFDKTVFSQPAAFTFGNMGPRVSDIRNDGIFNWDLSVFKNFRVVERVNMQFRAEALNAFNTPRFGSPNTNVTSSSFGVITSQANAPRQIQFGLKILF